MKNILVTNFRDSGEDVMIFSKTLTVEKVEAALKRKGEEFGEIYEVSTKELHLYIYEPCWVEDERLELDI